MTPVEIASKGLSAYEQGDLKAVELLSNLRKELFDKISFGKPKPNGQVYCVYNLLVEWNAIHNSEVPVPKGIEAVRKLISWVEHNENADMLKIYRQPEWNQLVQLRGPVETILHFRCRKCGKEFLGMGTSGFTDENGWICSTCGSVIFRSIYNSDPAPTCKCGGKTFSDCPVCNARDAQLFQESSPYGYFANHSWQRVN